MAKTNLFVFKALHIIAWIIFVGLCIEAGALLVNFIFSIFKPDVVQHLYQKLDMSAMYARSKWAYYGMYSYILVIAVLKAVLFYIVIQLMSKLNLQKPFSQHVSNQITSISYYTLAIGLISISAKFSAKTLQHYGYETNNLSKFWEDSQAFILMAAVIYIIATIFRKGIEIQNENDLTV